MLVGTYMNSNDTSLAAHLTLCLLTVGAGYSQVNKPIMCFNAAKNWQLGWYSDKSTEVSVTRRAWRGRLYGYSDYQSSPGHVLLKVGDDIFLQYNKMASMNKDTTERRNQVVINRSSIAGNAKSHFIGSLATTDNVLIIENYSNGRSLLIEVCAILQLENSLKYFDLMIRLSDQASLCGQQEATQTAPPLPTPVPTPAPTRKPTPAPTIHVIAPTPSRVPTPYPTKHPTSFPTTQPSVIPSVSPSLSLSGMPSTSPSVRSSTFPSLGPSSYPSSELTCDDHKHARFLVNLTSGFAYESCIWLSARSEWQKKVCVETHPAYTLCEETCGSCTDTCRDSDDTFEHHGINRPCSWLTLRWGVQKEICVPGHPVMDVCQETCDVCDLTNRTTRL